MKHRPYITINVAMTADGKIDTIERQGETISSPEDWQRVDRLRAENDAILVGGRTLLEEDPRLTVKSPLLQEERVSRGQESNPIKVGIVSLAEVLPESRFLTHGPARVIIFTTHRTPFEQISSLRAQGVQVFVHDQEGVDLIRAMAQLYELGAKRILVEGGGTIISALLQQGLADELHIFLAPMIFGGADAPTLADGTGLSREHAVQLKLQSVESLENGGLLIQYRLSP